MSETRVAVLVGSLRADSVNRKLAELLRDQAPEGVTLDLVDGLDQLPFYNEDLDPAAPVPAAAAALRERVGARRPRPGGDAGVQRHHAGRAQQRHRLALAALRPGAMNGKPFGVVGTTPTPYGGKWSHADAPRSAGIAGAVVVEDVTVSQSSIDVDVLADAEVLGKLHAAVARLVDFQPETVAA